MVKPFHYRFKMKVPKLQSWIMYDSNGNFQPILENNKQRESVFP